MILKVRQNLQKIPHWEHKKYLLAISGGIDSMVLTTLFDQLGLQYEWAHCNFKLRGVESDRDQAFVENYAQKHRIPLHLNVCDLSQSQENIQIAARMARYDWFTILQQSKNFDYIVTGHHLDDSLETFFINLQRGTGLKGLLGIRDNDKILRPLLNINRKAIREYARIYQLNWREDSSNASEKYKRNFIRHQIIPKLTENQPAFYHNFLKTLNFLQQNQAITEAWFEREYQTLIIKNKEFYLLDLQKFKTVNQKELFLFNWLSPFGFTDIKAALNLLTGQTGKEIFSPAYRLTKQGEYLILQPIQEKNTKTYEISDLVSEIDQPVSLKMTLFDRNKIEKKVFLSAKKNEVYIDYDLLKFPLTIRKWQAGDYFYPLGMSGKKKISDYLKDEKIALPEKEKIWLLCNQNKIIWVIGMRLDNRYKITDKTKHILHLILKNKT